MDPLSGEAFCLRSLESDGLLISPLVLEDIDQILAIEALVNPSPCSERTLIGLVSKEGTSLGLKDNSGLLIGYACFSKVLDESELFITAIHPKWQGQSLGKKLLIIALNKLKQLGITRVFLEVRESNSPAITVYRQLEFEPCGERKGYYSVPNSPERETALLFFREL